MFHGTTTAPVRNFIAQDLQSLKPTKLYEPFAGIFMVSQIAGIIDKKIVVESSDASIYSATIGDALAGNPVVSSYTPHALETVPYWSGKTSADDLACAMIYFMEVAMAFKKRETIYYGRMLSDLRANVETYHKSILDKMNKIKESLGDFRFRGIDACVLLDEAKEGDVVFYDPPFFMGDYEKMFALLPEYISRPEIPYTEINEEVKEKQLQWLADKGCIVYYRDHRSVEIPNYTMRFRCEYKFNGYFYIYSNRKERNILQRHVRLRENDKVKYPFFWRDDEITAKSKVELVPTDSKTVNHYRLLWTKKAEMRDAGGAFFLLSIDGKVAGVVVIMSGMQFNHNYAVIIADATTPYSKYKRLSKLTLKCILNQEFMRRLETKFKWHTKGFSTIAFSDKNYSSKYRGLMEKTKCEENKQGLRYKMTYACVNPKTPTIKAAFKEWLQKYGKEIKDDTDSGHED